MNKILPLIFLTFIGACQTMDYEQCYKGDWKNFGFMDGSNGYNQLAQRKEECSEKNIVVRGTARETDYEAGFAEGLKTYCQADNLYQEGLNGQQYSGLCPKEDEDKLLRHYRIGFQIHQLNTDNRDLQNKIEEIDRKMMFPNTTEQQKRILESDRRRIQTRIDQNDQQVLMIQTSSILK